jgi:hypothetical protein
MSRKCPGYVPAMSRSNPTVENQCKACHLGVGAAGAAWVSLRVLRLARRQLSSSFSDSNEMQVEKPVQGPSHSGGVRALVSMELSASNERLDFAFP